MRIARIRAATLAYYYFISGACMLLPFLHRKASFLTSTADLRDVLVEVGGRERVRLVGRLNRVAWLALALLLFGRLVVALLRLVILQVLQVVLSPGLLVGGRAVVRFLEQLLSVLVHVAQALVVDHALVLALDLVLLEVVVHLDATAVALLRVGRRLLQLEVLSREELLNRLLLRALLLLVLAG